MKIGALTYIFLHMIILRNVTKIHLKCSVHIHKTRRPSLTRKKDKRKSTLILPNKFIIKLTRIYRFTMDSYNAMLWWFYNFLPARLTKQLTNSYTLILPFRLRWADIKRVLIRRMPYSENVISLKECFSTSNNV